MKRVVVAELPLFLFATFAWGIEAVRNYEGLLRLDADVTVWEYIGRISMTTPLAFLLCLFSFYTKRLGRFLSFAFVLCTTLLVVCVRELASMEICAAALQLILETNPTEASSFFYIYIVSWRTVFFLCVFICLTAGIVWTIHFWKRNRHRWEHKLNIPLSIICGITLLGTGLFATYTMLLLHAAGSNNAARWAIVRSVPSPHDPITKTALAIYSLKQEHNNVRRCIQTSAQYSNNELSGTESDSLNIILVIGESYIRSHCALYGYPLPTTSRMQKEIEARRLFVFNDAVTPATMTFQALREMLFIKPDNRPWYEGVFLPVIFKSAGFNVTFLDNQVRMETGATRKGQGYTLLNPMFQPEMLDLAYDTLIAPGYNYDEEMLTSLYKLPNTNKLNFIIVHFKGQHFDAAKSFPHNSNTIQFTPSDYDFRHEKWLTDAMKQHISDYDNATLYNDSLLGTLFLHYQNKPSAIVYLSDHGEEVYDYRPQWGRLQRIEDTEQAALYYQIPMIVWLSEPYQKKYPTTTQNLIYACNKPFISTYISQVLFALAQISSSYYYPERDPLSQDYNAPKRILLDGNDFDQLVTQLP